MNRKVEGDRGAGTWENKGGDVGRKREDAERDAGVMWGREAEEEWGTLNFLMTFSLF